MGFRSPGSSRLEQAIHDGSSQAGRWRGLGYDQIERERIEPAHGGKKAGGGFAGIIEGSEHFHCGKLKRSDGAAPGQKAGTPGALPDLALVDAGEENDGDARCIMAVKLAGGLD